MSITASKHVSPASALTCDGPRHKHVHEGQELGKGGGQNRQLISPRRASLVMGLPLTQKQGPREGHAAAPPLAARAPSTGHIFVT